MRHANSSASRLTRRSTNYRLWPLDTLCSESSIWLPPADRRNDCQRTRRDRSPVRPAGGSTLVLIAVQVPVGCPALSTALQHPAPERPRPFLEPPLRARTGPDRRDLLPARVALPSQRRAESTREAPPREPHSHRLQGRSSARRRARVPARGSGAQQPARWPWSTGGESAGPACECHSRPASPAPWV